MDRAALGDLHDALLLVGGQRSSELDSPLYTVEIPFFRFAFGAIHGVNPVVTQVDGDLIESPSLPSRIQRDRHRRSRAQRRNQQLIRRGPGIPAAKLNRLVAGQVVRARRHHLGQFGCDAANGYDGLASDWISRVHLVAPCVSISDNRKDLMTSYKARESGRGRTAGLFPAFR
jgi:hypothetical protein